jgi:hypothetical protein
VKRSTLVAILLDLVVYAVMVWVALPDDVRRSIRARMLWELAAFARRRATAFGVVALEAENHYWKVVRP